MKRAVSSLLKRRVAAQQKWHCNICTRMLDEYYEVDHVRPLWLGGVNDRANLQALCTMCHKEKTFNENVSRGPSGSIAKCTLCSRTYSLYFRHCRCAGSRDLILPRILHNFRQKRHLKVVRVQIAGGKGRQ